TRMLHPLIERGLKVWSQRDIPKGSKWFPEIKKKLSQTKVAVLFVSGKFVSSEFIESVELHEFLAAQQDNSVTILWVLVSDCRWDLTPINEFSPAYSTEIPLIKLPEGEQDSALTDLTREIEKAANLRTASVAGNEN